MASLSLITIYAARTNLITHARSSRAEHSAPAAPSRIHGPYPTRRPISPSSRRGKSLRLWQIEGGDGRFFRSAASIATGSKKTQMLFFIYLKTFSFAARQLSNFFPAATRAEGCSHDDLLHPVRYGSGG